MPVNTRFFIELRHSLGQPFCEDRRCPCHQRIDKVRLSIINPLVDGLITGAESVRLFQNRHIDLTSKEGEIN